MGSHSATCHQAEMTFPGLDSNQLKLLVLDSAAPE